MTQTITRIYESRDHAQAAATDLEEAGFTGDQFILVPHPGGEHDAATAEMVERLVVANVLKAHAAAYAAEVVQGGAILTVFAPFGKAGEAEQVLAAHNPVGPTGFDAAGTGLWGWDESAPFSSGFFGWPVKYDDATPFSKFWSIPVLIDPAKVSTEKWGWPTRAKNAMTLGRYEQLWDNPTPLSTKLGWSVKAASQFFMDFWPLLTDARNFMAPPKLTATPKKFTESFGLLSDKPFTFPSWPMLTAKVAPLSDALNLPLLTAKEIVITALPLLTSAKETFPSIIEGSKKVTSMFPMLASKEVVLGMWPLLSEKIAPLSDALKLPVLTAKEVVLSFWPLLAKDGYSLSGAFGVPLLAKGRAIKP